MPVIKVETSVASDVLPSAGARLSRRLSYIDMYTARCTRWYDVTSGAKEFSSLQWRSPPPPRSWGSIMGDLVAVPLPPRPTSIF